ncbi:MAG: GMC family oxidoreductase N-terminal domain-containing protein [Arthrobacter sp.]|nr:GMC family oxidoreductase N-terminal domain-containing protein [Arthrobacter sp.]
MERIWDFVVVGKSPAGAALAAELSARSSSSILMLDLGESTMLPAAAVRPHVLEFDDWAAVGASEWAPEAVLPHFRRIETDHDFGSLRYHGSEGMLQLGRSPEERWTLLDQGFRVAALENGHPWAPDHNAPGVLGVSPLAWAAGGAGPALPHASMMTVLDAEASVEIRRVDAVDRVLWEDGNARGVRICTDSKWHDVEAREVVLCAGGIDSPTILQRSGIGPARHLESVGIAPRLDLPVGQSLQVHPQLRMLHTPDAGAVPGFNGGMLARWNTGLEGTSSGDLMAWTVNGTRTRDGGLVGALAQVFSRGSVLVAGPEPTVAPFVDARMLSSSLDGCRFRLLYRHLSDLAARPSLARHLPLPHDTNGKSWISNQRDTEVEAWLSSVVEPLGDYAGSCRMGQPGDPDAVVDGAGRVFGIRGLRVADSSVSPQLVRAPPLLTDVVIGSRMARLMWDDQSPFALGKRPN